MDVPSAKKEIISDFFSIASDKLVSKKLVLITTAGIISGKYKPDPQMDKKLNFKELDKESAYALTVKLTSAIANNYKKTYSIKSPLPDNDGYILLENVEIQNGDAVKHFPSLVVFFDQIVGI
mgnify:FL=1